MKVHVEVKQKHIDEGIRSDCFDCPIALAMLEATGKQWRVEEWIMRHGEDWVEMPENVSRFVHAFDRHDYEVQPFAFDIELP
jgi:hypothetical protein